MEYETLQSVWDYLWHLGLLTDFITFARHNLQQHSETCPCDCCLRFEFEPALEWLRDLPEKIKARHIDLKMRVGLIHEALVPSGYSFDYRWYRLREAFGLLTKSESK